MNDEKIEIVDDNKEIQNNTSNNSVSDKTEVFELPKQKEDIKVGETKVLSVKENKRKLKEEQKRKKHEEKLRKKELKKNKNKKKDEEIKTDNVYENQVVDIAPTAVIKGASGSVAIGNINGETITPTNSPMPLPIDITIKKKIDNKTKVKKVKVVTKKEKILSVLISIFVIIVLGGAGYAAYYFGYETNPNIFEVKTYHLELGDELPNSVTNYVTSPHVVDDMKYTLDFSRVATDVVGSYIYSVSHENVVKSGQIIVEDTKAPELTFFDNDELVFLKDSEVDKDDIVLSCEDISNCTYKTEYEISTETPGDKQVTVIARDDIGNETRKTLTIKVIEIKQTLICTSPEIKAEDNSYVTITEDTLNFDSNDYLVKKSGIKKYIYSDYSAYFAKLNELQNDTRYIFDKPTFSYKTNSEPNTNNLTNFNDIVKYYTDNGYVCK